MRRPWLAGTLLLAGATAILVIWFGFGGDHAPHAHAGEDPTSAIAATVTGAAATAGAGPGVSAAAGTAVPSSISTGHDHPGHSPAASSTPPAEPVAAAVPDDPNAPAADRRQVSLAEAAGGAGVPSTTAAGPAGNKWIDADAAGVNEGTKQQAAGVALAPASVVDPSQMLPANGLTNGCVAGYGRGTQCLPQTPPSHAGHGVGDMSIYWTCAEARTLLPDGIVVDTPGTDPLGLDSNGDGTACGAGDR